MSSNVQNVVITGDVYNELYKAFDHNLNYFTIDLYELVQYSSVYCTDMIHYNKKLIMDYFVR